MLETGQDLGRLVRLRRPPLQRVGPGRGKGLDVELILFAFEALAQQVGQKHSANEGVKMQMHQMLFGRPA